MFYTVYKTTNLINGKYYIGAHKTLTPYDTYLGSGVALKKAIEKYGEQNFTKDVLFIFDNAEDMYTKEKELVVISESSYNMMPGGKGGWDHIDTSGENNPMKNPEVAARMVESARKSGSYHTEKKIKACLTNLEKAVEYNIGKKRPEHSEFMKTQAKKYWEENKEFMRDALSSWFVVIDPEGNEYETNRLQEFCEQMSLPYTTVWKSSKSHKTPNRGKAKGWLCIKK